VDRENDGSAPACELGESEQEEVRGECVCGVSVSMVTIALPTETRCGFLETVSAAVNEGKYTYIKDEHAR
jgi:hypothetical protein